MALAARNTLDTVNPFDDGLRTLDSTDGAVDELPSLFPRRISRSELIYVTTQLAIMVETGITLSAALEGIRQQERNPSLRDVLRQLKESVEAGDDFSSALAQHPRLFDTNYVSLVKASEATGQMGEMLERIADYLRKEKETRSKVRAAMAYPCVMLVVAIAVTIFLLTYVLPKFTPLFESRGKSLPGMTRMMMSASQVLIGYWYVWLASVIALIGGMVYALRTEQGLRAWHWIKINLPILGPMFRKVIISRSIRTLGTMIASGVPVLDALRHCADVSGNLFYHDMWLGVADDVIAGKQICETLRGNPLMPPVLVQMISSGEETGKLDDVLMRVSDYYDGEVETSLKTTTSLIEPLMITIMGVIVGGIGMALLLPIFTLSRPQ
jgi:type IV pilus assembly protein PilC